MYRGSRLFTPGTRLKSEGPISSLDSWKRHPGIKDEQ